jgi:hypothetical protein
MDTRLSGTATSVGEVSGDEVDELRDDDDDERVRNSELPWVLKKSIFLKNNFLFLYDG